MTARGQQRRKVAVSTNFLCGHFPQWGRYYTTGSGNYDW